MRILIATLFAITMLAITMLGGCASTPPTLVPEAEGVQSVSAIALGCGKPWPITRDCSNMAGPKKLVEVNGVRFKVGGSDDGKITLMFGGTRLGNQGKTSNAGFEMMKRELVTRGHSIVSVTPIISSGTVFGYAIETEAASYELWDEFAVE